MSATLGSVRLEIGAADVPPALGALVTLDDPHYIDVFTLTTRDADRWTAAVWARAMFEDDRPLLTRAATRGLLGVKLGRPGPEGRVGEYTVASSDSATLRGDAVSPLTSAQAVVHVGADEVSLVTAVRCRGPLGRIVLTIMSGLHRSLAPQMLRHAAAHIGDRHGLPSVRPSAEFMPPGQRIPSFWSDASGQR